MIPDEEESPVYRHHPHMNEVDMALSSSHVRIKLNIKFVKCKFQKRTEQIQEESKAEKKGRVLDLRFGNVNSNAQVLRLPA